MFVILNMHMPERMAPIGFHEEFKVKTALAVKAVCKGRA
jgi:hypothetical protein